MVYSLFHEYYSSFSRKWWASKAGEMVHFWYTGIKSTRTSLKFYTILKPQSCLRIQTSIASARWPFLKAKKKNGQATQRPMVEGNENTGGIRLSGGGKWLNNAAILNIQREKRKGEETEQTTVTTTRSRQKPKQETSRFFLSLGRVNGKRGTHIRERRYIHKNEGSTPFFLFQLVKKLFFDFTICKFSFCLPWENKIRGFVLGMRGATCQKSIAP